MLLYLFNEGEFFAFDVHVQLSHDHRQIVSINE